MLWGAKLLAVPPGGVVQVAGVQSAAADSGSWMRQGQKAERDTFFLKQYIVLRGWGALPAALSTTALSTTERSGGSLLPERSAVVETRVLVGARGASAPLISRK